MLLTQTTTDHDDDENLLSDCKADNGAGHKDGPVPGLGNGLDSVCKFLIQATQKQHTHTQEDTQHETRMEQ